MGFYENIFCVSLIAVFTTFANSGEPASLDFLSEPRFTENQKVEKLKTVVSSEVQTGRDPFLIFDKKTKTSATGKFIEIRLDKRWFIWTDGKIVLITETEPESAKEPVRDYIGLRTLEDYIQDIMDKKRQEREAHLGE